VSQYLIHFFAIFASSQQYDSLDTYLNIKSPYPSSHIMEYNILTSENFKTQKWSGGTTTELFIFPKSASYKKQNFQFRLSTAQVKIEKSDFSILPGISRKLMVLDGNIYLTHKKQYSKKLKKWDVDAFEGDWETSCQGKCTDFNLMTSASITGELSAIQIKKNLFVNPTIHENCTWFFMYIFSGKVSLNVNHILITIRKGDLLVIRAPTLLPFEIKTEENSELVFSEIIKIK